MINIKRRWSGVIVTVAIVGLLGANMVSAQGATKVAKLTGTITVTSNHKHAMLVAAAFMKRYPGIKVKVQVITDATALQQQIRTQLTSGTAPDVFTVWPGNGSPLATTVLNKAGNFLEDLKSGPWAKERSRQWVKKMPANFIAGGSYEGRYTTAIYGGHGIGAIYDKTTLDADGLTAPTTWTQLLSFCRAAVGKGKVAFALANQEQWITQLINYALVPSLVYSKDKNFDAKMAAGTASFGTSGWKTAFTKYMEMNTSGCFNKDPLSLNYAGSQALVATHGAYGLINGDWAVVDIQKQVPNDKFILLQLPATDNPADQWMAIAAGAGLGINAKSKNLALANAFLDFYMSPAGLRIVAPIDGGIPPFKVRGLKLSPILGEVQKYMAANKGTAFMDQNWPNAKVQSEHLVGIQDIFAGKATIAEVLAKMDAAYKQG